MQQVTPHKRWPSGNPRPIAMLRFTTEELSLRLGLVFEKRADDLDEFDLAALEDAEIGQIWLTQYVNNPVSGTEVWVDSDQNVSKALDVSLNLLGLTQDSIIWKTQYSNKAGSSNDELSQNAGMM